jgi:hypothetical protein
MHDLEPRLAMAAVGALLLVGGLALAVNFRGVSTWHARRSIDSVRWLERPLRQIPPWKGVLGQPMERRLAHQVALLRFIGGTFAAVGVVLLISAAVAHNISTT